MSRPIAALLCGVFLTTVLAGCPNIRTEEWTSKITAEFNPDPVNPAVPTPIDIPGMTKDPTTGLVTAPVPEGASEAYVELFGGYVNTLDGWALNSSLSFAFTGTVRHDTVTPDTVMVFREHRTGTDGGLERVPGIVPVPTDLPVDPADPGGAMKTTVSLASPTPLDPGTTYVVAVRGESAKGVLSTGDVPVGSPFTFNLLKSRDPLISLIDNPGDPERNPYVRTRIFLPNDSEEDIAALRVLESLRQQYAPLIATLGDAGVMGERRVPREELVLLWTFETQTDTIAQFDPVFAVVPTPTDLLMADGKLAFPVDAANDPPAQTALFEWLNTQDGHSVLSALEVKFSGPVDPASFTSDSVRVFDITDRGDVVEVRDVVYDYDEASYGLAVRKASVEAPFEHGHQYAVAILSGKGVAGVVTPDGAAVVRSQAMALALLSAPLTNDTGASLLPGVLSDADAQQFEGVRSGYDAVVRLLAARHGLDRAQLASLWTFTTGSGAKGESLIDPNAGVLPTPNDLILDPSNLNVLIEDAQSDAERNFFAWLGQQGGWSGVINGATSFSQPLDTDTIPDAFHVFEVSVRLGELDDIVFDLPPDPDAEVRSIVFHRTTAWKPGTMYFAVVTDDLRTASGGEILPSSFTVLLRGEHPLSSAGKSQVPAALSDADAAQLELLRFGLGGMLGEATEALGISRENVLAFWTFSIQSANEALYSPSTGVLPFPNEVLQPTELDDTLTPARPFAGIPLLPPSPYGAGHQALRDVLAAEMDGFSVVEPSVTAFLRGLDPASFTTASTVLEVPETAVGYADISDIAIVPGQPLTTSDLLAIHVQTPAVDFDAASGLLRIGPPPGKPLLQNHRMMVAITDKLESAEDRPIHISPTFWFARSPDSLISEEGKSLVASLSDADAVQLEQLRLAYSPMFDGFDAVGELGMDFSRQDVLLFSTYWTQNVTGELEGLREALYAEALSAEPLSGAPLAPTRWHQHPALATVMDDDPEASVENAGVMFLDQRIPSFNLLEDTDLGRQDAPVWGSFRASEDDGSPGWRARDLMVDIFVPQQTATRLMPFRVVVFLHGFGGQKEDVVRGGLLDQLLDAGFVVVSADLPLHGGRKWSPAGQVESGDGFLAPDPVAFRDHIAQAVLDHFQLVRVVQADLARFLAEHVDHNLGGEVVDTARVALLGSSAGAMVGALLLATEPGVDNAVLNAPGAHWGRLIRETNDPWLQCRLRGLLCGQLGSGARAESPSCGLTPVSEDYEYCAASGAGGDYGVSYADIPWKTRAAAEVVRDLQWYLERADPLAFAPYVFQAPLYDVSRAVLLQVGQGDQRFGAGPAEELRDALGTAAEYELYGVDCHSFLLAGCGVESPSAATERQRAKDDIVTFLRNGSLAR